MSLKKVGRGLKPPSLGGLVVVFSVVRGLSGLGLSFDDKLPLEGGVGLKGVLLVVCSTATVSAVVVWPKGFSFRFLKRSDKLLMGAVVVVFLGLAVGRVK